jgi:hypothetical protein
MDQTFAVRETGPGGLSILSHSPCIDPLENIALTTLCLP